MNLLLEWAGMVELSRCGEDAIGALPDQFTDVYMVVVSKRMAEIEPAHA